MKKEIYYEKLAVLQILELNEIFESRYMILVKAGEKPTESKMLKNILEKKISEYSQVLDVKVINPMYSNVLFTGDL